MLAHMCGHACQGWDAMCSRLSLLMQAKRATHWGAWGAEIGAGAGALGASEGTQHDPLLQTPCIWRFKIFILTDTSSKMFSAEISVAVINRHVRWDSKRTSQSILARAKIPALSVLSNVYRRARLQMCLVAWQGPVVTWCNNGWGTHSPRRDDSPTPAPWAMRRWR